eukprot:g32100.t1
MGMEVKMAEEEFNIMSCPKFIKVGTQRNKVEAFAEYSMFNIGERKEVTKRIDKDRIVDIVYLDFSKAFDKVLHGSLFSKVKSRGIQ